MLSAAKDLWAGCTMRLGDCRCFAALNMTFLISSLYSSKFINLTSQERKSRMAAMDNVKGVLKAINSVSFLQVINDNGKTTLFIPAWPIVLGIVLFVLIRRVSRNK